MVKDKSKQETVIKELVQCFLIPNIERSRLQNRVQLEQRRYAEAVKDSLKGAMGDALNKKQNK